MDEDDEHPNTRASSKVAALIDKYELEASFGDELETRWTSDSNDRLSLRALADLFNRQLLETAMEDAGVAGIKGDTENIYRLLTDNVSSGVRAEAQARLERNGIDVQRLQQDFVSHQAIHTYLTKHQGVQYQKETSEQDRVERTEKTIQRLKSRLIAVAEKRLRSLREAETITLGTFSVLVDVRVICEDCGTHTDIPTLLSERRCDCDSDK